MASDSPDSRRKHPNSASEDESLGRSKRHKHRHHHHRSHHRHHRQSSGSKDHDDENRGDVAEVHGGVTEEVKTICCSTQAVADSEMEEGEIVEDEEFAGGRVEFMAGLALSASESGEIRNIDSPSKTDNSNTKIMEQEEVFRLSEPVVNSRENLIEVKSLGNSRRKGNNFNGFVGCPSTKSYKDDSKMNRRSNSPAKAKIKYRGLNGVQVEEGSRLDRYGASQSPSQGQCHDESPGRSRSKSPMHRKSDSENISTENYLRQRNFNVCCDNERADAVVYDERITVTSRDKHHIRDSNRDKDRERRHAISKGRHCDSHPWDFESEHRDRKMKKEIKDRYRDRDEEKQHLESNRKQEFSRITEAKKEREHDTKVEKMGRSNESICDEEYDNGSYRENDYRHSNGRDLKGEYQRGSIRSSHKDMDTEREREKGRERYKDRSHNVSERLRDNGSDRHRDMIKEAGRDRVGRHYGRDEDRYGSRGRSYDSKHRAYASEDYYRDKKRISDSEKGRSSWDDTSKERELKVNRDEDAQDDHSENMELEVLEQEEEDINRIKEESRKRREAILQKYRKQESQQKVDQVSDTSEKATNKDIFAEPSGLPVAAQVLQRKSDDEGDHSFSVGKSPQNEAFLPEKISDAGGLGEGTPKSERSNDMFCDDIFGASPAEVRKTGKGDGLLVDKSGLYDNWDDPEGYYGYRLGEILDGRYEVTAAHGKGVFSTVVRARDLKAGNGGPEEVAIKIIRNNDTMLKAGMEELIILKKLVGADPDDRRHCVRYISSFKYRNHLCLVFESLHMNLREVLKKFGRNIGLKLTAVRAYSKQLFIALKHLRNCGVLHCDIKPDNMLVNDAKNVLKLCDFGNAMFAGKNEVTPYLVSRFYRAPEIILGLTYDHPLDIWSVGCCLYELYTGKVLFPGPSNNDMLRLHMELKGPFPKKMLRKGAFTAQHFDHDLNFLSIEEDLVTKKSMRRLIVNIKPKDIGTIIKGSPGDDPKMLANFKDLLDKMFVLDPDKRLTISQALSHPFITGNP
ncbi:hypothetical protein V2J09_008743 [Rumex salicifolius]